MQHSGAGHIGGAINPAGRWFLLSASDGAGAMVPEARCVLPVACLCAAAGRQLVWRWLLAAGAVRLCAALLVQPLHVAPGGSAFTATA